MCVCMYIYNIYNCLCIYICVCMCTYMYSIYYYIIRYSLGVLLFISSVSTHTRVYDAVTKHAASTSISSTDACNHIIDNYTHKHRPYQIVCLVQQTKTVRHNVIVPIFGYVISELYYSYNVYGQFFVSSATQQVGYSLCVKMENTSCHRINTEAQPDQISGRGMRPVAPKFKKPGGIVR